MPTVAETTVPARGIVFLSRPRSPGDARSGIALRSVRLAELEPAKILRGAPVARRIRAEVNAAAEGLVEESGVRPTLATLLVGAAPPSVAYRDAIARAMAGCGIEHIDVVLPVAAPTGRVVETIRRLNRQRDVHGILVLMPLPTHIDALEVLSTIAPEKDVDGIAPASVGRLHLGLPALHPSTPQAGIELLDYYQIPIAGKEAVVVGRGNVVGKPMAALLTRRDATVTLCHTRTASLANETRRGEIVVLAAGSPGLLHGSMLQPGATVIDFGVNVIEGKVVGDADDASIAAVAGAYTPVPGGTTPVTTMALARNTVTAAFALTLDDAGGLAPGSPGQDR